MAAKEVSYEGKDLEVLAHMPNYYEWIIEIFAPYIRGHVIEYGAGLGTVSEKLLEYADTITLVEPAHNLAAMLRARFVGDSRIDIVSEPLEQHVLQLKAGAFDTAILVNVLEHIEDDRSALSHLMRILRPGGNLLVFVPALKFLMSELDLLLGHHRRYVKPELVTNVADAGGEVLDCRYFDLVGVIPWLILNKFLRTKNFNTTLVQINDRLIVPVSRFVEGFVSPPFGKNLLLVAQRPRRVMGS